MGMCDWLFSFVLGLKVLRIRLYYHTFLAFFKRITLVAARVTFKGCGFCIVHARHPVSN